MFSPSMMGKKSLGGTLSYYDGKKECGVHVHFQISTIQKGGKECSTPFLPICMVWKKEWEGTPFLPICMVG